MEIKGTHRFNADPQTVWNALHNSSVLQSTIPGVQSVTWQGDNALNMQANVEIGPIKRAFAGTVQVSESAAPSHMKLSIQRSIVNANANIDLAPDGSGTQLSYTASAQLSGPLAAADMIAKPMVESQLNSFFSRLDQQIG